MFCAFDSKPISSFAQICLHSYVSSYGCICVGCDLLYFNLPSCLFNANECKNIDASEWQLIYTGFGDFSNITMTSCFYDAKSK